PTAETGQLQVSPDITLRRMVVTPPSPKGTVLFLHGFSETMLTWRSLSQQLGSEYEVHAFDWPGYGQSSRPPAGIFNYAPRDYAQVLKSNINGVVIDKPRPVISATNIGGLPPLLLALEQRDIAKKIIAGAFAPFDRPQSMAERLPTLKRPQTAEA